MHVFTTTPVADLASLITDDTVSLECTCRPDPEQFADICAALKAGD